MRNHLFLILVVLIFSASLNQGEGLKINDRRASGLMAYPRIGRANLPVSGLNFNPRRDTEPETDLQLYNSDIDFAQDKDYEDPRNPAAEYHGKSMNPKHAGKIPKEAIWLMPDRLRSSKDYRTWQTIDDDRTSYPDSPPLITGSRNSQLNGYTRRLGNENDAERALCK